jgi:hypothetical protein
VPAAPTTVISRTSITITWVAPVDGGSAITGYTVAVKKSDGITYTPYAGCSVSITSCPIPLSDLQASPYNLTGGATFYATVLATNAVGSSASSAPGDGAVLPPPAPVVVPPSVVWYPVDVDLQVVEAIVIPQIVKILESNYYATKIDRPKFSNVVSKLIILQTGNG